jgi:hypothetical protein
MLTKAPMKPLDERALDAKGQNLQDQCSQVLADLQEAINDKAVLLLDPEAHTRSLTELVQAAYQAGVINVVDQREYLEWVDSAYAWAIQELNQ